MSKHFKTVPISVVDVDVDVCQFESTDEYRPPTIGLAMTILILLHSHVFNLFALMCSICTSQVPSSLR